MDKGKSPRRPKISSSVCCDHDETFEQVFDVRFEVPPGHRSEDPESWGFVPSGFLEHSDPQVGVTLPKWCKSQHTPFWLSHTHKVYNCGKVPRLSLIPKIPAQHAVVNCCAPELIDVIKIDVDSPAQQRVLCTVQSPEQINLRCCELRAHERVSVREGLHFTADGIPGGGKVEQVAWTTWLKSIKEFLKITKLIRFESNHAIALHNPGSESFSRSVWNVGAFCLPKTNWMQLGRIVLFCSKPSPVGELLMGRVFGDDKSCLGLLRLPFVSWMRNRSWQVGEGKEVQFRCLWLQGFLGRYLIQWGATLVDLRFIFLQEKTRFFFFYFVT